MGVFKKERAESAGAGVPEEHQESGEKSLAAPAGKEDIAETGEAPKDEEVPACKQEHKEEGAPEVVAPVPHVEDETLPED